LLESPIAPDRWSPAVIRLVHASDRAVLLVFGDAITEAAGQAVRRLAAWLAEERPAALVDLNPGYSSLLVRYDPLRGTVVELERELLRRAATLDRRPEPPGRSFEIPVRYGGEDGPDLAEVARAAGAAASEIVALHAGASYEVRFIGFSPGFPYLAGLPGRLHVPRRPSPRSRVPAGSVAIAGGQAGIYPVRSPGGWNVIGRTDFVLFDPGAEEGAILKAGDRVRFRVER
jgi:inhibitor of KinA